MSLALLLLMAILGTALPPINGNPSLRPNNLLVQTHCFIIFDSTLQPSYSFKQLGGLRPSNAMRCVPSLPFKMVQLKMGETSQAEWF